ncbi:EAL domain-containing protein (putative c-di-GMP-specific phosphodiesterase class I) [Tamilnaduibacter salinus]|uniref:EAL domain-containing protein (Putative c-di-GMP-specific phosphodiesterase class I) n=1 Tax=Tamilnaduibacter salinus TaxID=1484056 RepID=A0A2U1CWK9_9GAMM|nr:EAL domain-containing protein [Tamilnaduibacter salinus]PVY76333.1 EAL domain-containing protein (putative c-di-GMP-specific phosphodiesterase class I) [Tamilnaduibacter salinus]
MPSKDTPAQPPRRVPGKLAPFLASIWGPLLFMALSLVAGALLLRGPADAITVLPAAPDQSAWPMQYESTEYRKQSLAEILSGGSALSEGWSGTASNWSGLGYLTGPVTFRTTFRNTRQDAIQRWVVVPAPFLDQIRPVRINHSDGRPLPMRTMGDQYPGGNRILDLPFWVWPVTVPPQTSVSLLFEVTNNGPLMLPVSIQSAWELAGVSGKVLTWQSLIVGSLVLTMLLNLLFTFLFRGKGISWLTVLLLSAFHNELVLSGFGLWLLWPQWPGINTLTSVTLPLCLIAVSQFSRHVLSLRGPTTTLMHGLSVAALVIMGARLAGLSFPGQGSMLVLGLTGCGLILGLSAQRAGHDLNARYMAIVILTLMVGAAVSSLRTIGWLPVNTLTNSGFSIGAVVANLVLTVLLIHRFVLERQQRRQFHRAARQEQTLRNRLEDDYQRLLRSHRVTRLPNRPVFEDVLATFNPEESPYAVVWVRLGRYYEIEQAVGYRHAEQLLRAYVTRFADFLERQLGDHLLRIENATIATLDASSHAFAIRALPQDATFWHSLADWLHADFTSGRYVFSWNPSIGVALAPEHGHIASDILSRAGFASLNPTDVLTFYDPATADRHNDQQLLMLDLDHALNSGDIEMHYQPKVRISNGDVVACEALIRWQHPDFGAVSPADWIPVAEKLGAIHQVTLWALDRAAFDLAALKQRFGDQTRVAVNISAHDLGESGFVEQALATVRRHGVSPGALILEITETAAMTDEARARTVISALSDEGFRIALDDFGTGYSSLGALASFELDELKIDRSFLAGITHSEPRQRVFFSAVELADALGLQVVVEGVEDREVADWLRRFPGLMGQGFYWGAPEPLSNR